MIEYCGEVIPQKIFQKRTHDYSESGVEHFYFMTLQSNEVFNPKESIDFCRLSMLRKKAIGVDS